MNQQLVIANLRNLLKVCPLEKVQVFNEDLISSEAKCFVRCAFIF